MLKCRDADEDYDDDGDGFDDAADDCNKVAGSSTLGAYTGCVDSDDDGWADLEDSCPNTPGNSTLGGTLACPDTDVNTLHNATPKAISLGLLKRSARKPIKRPIIE